MDLIPVSTALSRAPAGLSAPLVRVEVHLGPGLPAFFMVGLPETAVRESKERVRSALLTAGFSFPPGRITVNLSPADLPKDQPCIRSRQAPGARSPYLLSETM
jgi:magnesium chelatase family protein